MRAEERRNGGEGRGMVGKAIWGVGDGARQEGKE